MHSIFCVPTCVFHVFAKLFLDQLGLHEFLGLSVVLIAHCLVSRVEVSQQQRLLPLLCVDADCFQKGHPVICISKSTRLELFPLR